VKKSMGTTAGRKNGLPSQVTPNPANKKSSGPMQSGKMKGKKC